MNIYDFLSYLRAQDIQVTAENGKMRVNAPEGTITPGIKSELNARKAEILSLLGQEDPVPLASVDSPVLSLAQEHLWQLHRLTPDTVAYNMYGVFRISGPLDAVALECALQDVAERHVILRNSYPRSEHSEPEPTILPTSSIQLHRVTLSSSTGAQAELQSLIDKELRRPFDLFSGPLLRSVLAELDARESILILVMHHIISDGHSFGILYEDLERAYRARCEGGSLEWLPLPLQYADYAAWQRKWLDSGASDSSRNFWQKQLEGDVPALELPFDHPHPLHPAADGDEVELDIDPHLGSSLQEFCRREGITLFAASLAAFNVLLHRHRGQRDLIVCTPVAARDRIEFTWLIGYFNNTLLLRTDLTGIGTLRDLLRQTQTTIVNALAHQMLPFKEVAGFPNLVRVPLSRAMLVVQESGGTSLRLPGLDIEELPVFNHAVQYDLALELKVFPRRMAGRLMYRSSLFEQDTVEKLAKEYINIVREIITNADGPISRYRHERPAASPNRRVKSRPSFTAPRNELEHRLARIWQEVFQVESVGVYDEFFELGGHSLLALRLFTRIEQETGTNLPLSILFESTTVAHLAQLIAGRVSDTSGKIMIPIQPRGTRQPFYAIHGIEGGVLGYRDLANALGDDHPFIGLQAVGMDGRQEYDLTIEDMASRYIDVMRSHQTRGPYRIGGYCFGGVVAFEMARQLEKIGEQVSLLAVFEGEILEEPAGRVSLIHRLAVILRNLPTWVKDYSSMSPHQLGNRLRSTYKKIWSRLKYNPELERRVRVEETLDINVDNLPSRHIEMTDLCMNAANQYVPGEYNGVVTLFRARNRSINEVIFGSLDPSMGWRRLAKGGVDVRLVDGFHRNMHLAPYASSLAAELRKCLDSSADT